MEKRIHKAEEGKTYRRKNDNKIMGERLILGKFIDGTDDTIDNYEEVVAETTDRHRMVRRQMRRDMSTKRERVMKLRDKRNARRFKK